MATEPPKQGLAKWSEHDIPKSPVGAFEGLKRALLPEIQELRHSLDMLMEKSNRLQGCVDEALRNTREVLAWREAAKVRLDHLEDEVRELRKSRPPL